MNMHRGVGQASSQTVPRGDAKSYLAARARGELVIGRASRGYGALYRYVAAIDTVFVLALRAQREDGYKHEIGL
jgi:hypothetical protein